MFRNAALRSFLTGLGIAVLATACTPENVAGPQLAAAAPATVGVSASKGGLVGSLVGGLTSTLNTVVSDLLHPAIMRKHSLKHDVTVSRIIGVKGGKIQIGEAGLTIEFAPGALLQDTRITATANAGSTISYEFGPHGTQFHAPVTIEQDMKKTTIDKKVAQADDLFGGYMPNGVSDIVGDSVKVSELHKSDTKVGKDFMGRPELKTSTFTVSHFSGYILISGRR
jgi:hypothetical protein